MFHVYSDSANDQRIEIEIGNYSIFIDINRKALKHFAVVVVAWQVLVLSAELGDVIIE